MSIFWFHLLFANERDRLGAGILGEDKGYINKCIRVKEHTQTYFISAYQRVPMKEGHLHL